MIVMGGRLVFALVSDWTLSYSLKETRTVFVSATSSAGALGANLLGLIVEFSLSCLNASTFNWFRWWSDCKIHVIPYMIRFWVKYDPLSYWTWGIQPCWLTVPVKWERDLVQFKISKRKSLFLEADFTVIGFPRQIIVLFEGYVNMLG